MQGKCKVCYEFIQFDGNNGEDVASFIKEREIGNGLKLKHCVCKMCDGEISLFKYKIWNPSAVKEESVPWSILYEGQYLVWNPKTKLMLHVSLSQFKKTYVMDEEEDSCNNFWPSTTPIQPYPSPMKPWQPDPITYPPHWYSVTGTHPAESTGEITSSSVSNNVDNNTEWVFGKPGKITKQ